MVFLPLSRFIAEEKNNKRSEIVLILPNGISFVPHFNNALKKFASAKHNLQQQYCLSLFCGKKHWLQEPKSYKT
jgi:hypothetical protein